MNKCGQCGYTCTRKDNLLRHERSKHQNIKFNCAHCEYSCNRKDNLTRHIQIQHEGKLKRKIEPEPEKTKRKRYYEDNDIFNSDDEMEVDEDQILNESFSNHKCHVNEKVKARDNLDIDENVDPQCLHE